MRGIIRFVGLVELNMPGNLHPHWFSGGHTVDSQRGTHLYTCWSMVLRYLFTNKN